MSREGEVMMTKDHTNPDHYRQYPVECIEIIELMTNPLLANVVKYVWRMGDKDAPAQDKAKAIWYFSRYKTSEYANATEPLISIRVYNILETRLKKLRKYMPKERFSVVSRIVELNYRSKTNNRILVEHTKKLIEAL